MIVGRSRVSAVYGAFGGAMNVVGINFASVLVDADLLEFVKS